MAKIRGGKVKSISGLKSSLKKGGSGYLMRVPADSAVTVRFLTEPVEWVTYFEHYDDVMKFYPCTDDCPGCTEGDKPSARYLTNALDVEESKVVPLVLAKTAAASVLKKYEKYGTLLDRDYEISRSGSGFDTEYDVTPESPAKMNLKRFELLDLMSLLEAQLEMADVAVDDDADDDEEEVEAKPARRNAAKTAAKAPRKKTTAKPAPVDEDDEDDEDDDTDDEDDTVLTRESLAGKGLRELKRIGMDAGHTAADMKGLTVDSLIDLLAGEEDEDVDDEDVDDEDLEDEDLEEDEGWTREALEGMGLREVKKHAREAGYSTADLKGLDVDAVVDLLVGEEDEDEDDVDDDEEELTEDDLREMSLAELKKLAKENKVRIKPGTSKDDIIDLILDAADTDEIPF